MQSITITVRLNQRQGRNGHAMSTSILKRINTWNVQGIIRDHPATRISHIIITGTTSSIVIRRINRIAVEGVEDVFALGRSNKLFIGRTEFTWRRRIEARIRNRIADKQGTAYNIERIPVYIVPVTHLEVDAGSLRRIKFEIRNKTVRHF